MEQERSSNDSRSKYRRVREITEKHSTRMTVVTDKSGKVLTEHADVKVQWKEHCEDFYGKDNRVPDAPEFPSYVVEPEIVMSEVHEAIRRMRANKLPGIYNVSAELIKPTG